LSNQHPRLVREQKTMTAMLRLYCQDQHGALPILCPECQEILDYAIGRLEGCPFQEDKTTCAKCPVHCYKPAMRLRIRGVMRYAGPRMLVKHPILATLHLIDGFRKKPRRPVRKAVSDAVTKKTGDGQ
jgi:hypothetical protein